MKKTISLISTILVVSFNISCNNDDSTIINEEHQESANHSPTISGKVDGHDYVDLGLSVKWATMNIDANAIQDAGGYYAWGELSTKTSYTYNNYRFYEKLSGGVYKNKYLGADISGTEYDVAHVKWGGSWRMPTKFELDEIRDLCTIEWLTYKGKKGIMCTGPNGNSIFFPAAGHYDSDGLQLVNPYDTKASLGNYWSSTFYTGTYYGSDKNKYLQACSMNFANWQGANEASFSSEILRCFGLTIRAVNGSKQDSNGGDNDDESGEAPRVIDFSSTSTQSSITVKFMCNERPKKATIKYGLNSASTSISTSITAKQVSATVRGLKAGTKYYFKCTVSNDYGSSTSDEYPAMTNY